MKPVASIPNASPVTAAGLLRLGIRGTARAHLAALLIGLAWLPATVLLRLHPAPAVAAVTAAMLAGSLAVSGLVRHGAGRLASRIGRRQAALEQENRCFRAALDSMTLGTAIFDASGCVVSCNERLHQIAGLAPGRLHPGMTMREMLLVTNTDPGFDRTHVDAFVRQRMRDIAEGRPHRSIIHDVGERQLVLSDHPMRGGGWLTMVEQVADDQRVRAEMDFLKHYDPTTQLPNRAHLCQLLQAQLDRCDRDTADAWPAVIKIDIARYKRLHDSFGQDLVEKLLNEMKLRLQRCIGGSDTLARVRVDEFAVLLERCGSIADASALGSRMLDQLNGRYRIDGQTLAISASAGIALAPHHGSDAEELVTNASIAMRMAIRTRGECSVFRPEMVDALADRLGLEADLSFALADNQFELYYQPLIDLRRDRISCFEALLRWHHPTRGMISPLDFIPVAEASGLITPLGAWVLQRACVDAMSWPSLICVAVNLSAIQIRDPSLLATVRDALEHSGLAPARLELEVTETVLLEGDAAAVRVLHELRALGVRISMDDFGTGHSSLSYLRDFPFDKIKIDKSFVQQMLVRDDCLAIVRAVTGLASSLGMAVTAEGAEDLDQVDRLRLEGCTEVQGFYYSKPRRLSDVFSLFDQDFRRVAA